MARRSRRHYLDAPVSETCPLIDEVQGIINDAIEFLDGLDIEDDALKAEHRERISELRRAQKEVLEEVRQANQSLRRWGAEGVAAVEEAEEREKELEKERDALERQVARLEREAA